MTVEDENGPVIKTYDLSASALIAILKNAGHNRKKISWKGFGATNGSERMATMTIDAFALPSVVQIGD